MNFTVAPGKDGDIHRGIHVAADHIVLIEEVNAVSGIQIPAEIRVRTDGDRSPSVDVPGYVGGASRVDGSSRVNLANHGNIGIS